MSIPRNTDVGAANKTPGFYVQIVNGGGNAADAAEASTILLLGEMLSSGSWAPGSVQSPTSERDVIEGAGGGAAGAASPTVLLQYRAAMAQVGEGNVNVKICPVLEASGGTAATFQLIVHVVTPSTLAVATNPTVAGTLRVQVAGVEVSVGYTTSDTNATIAAALRAELLKQKYLPCTVGALSTATIPLTFGHKGAYGEDLPVRAYYTAGSGVYVGIGSLTYANIASGAGSAKLVMGTQTASASIANTDSAATVAAAMKAALLTDDYPLIAGAVATATIPLFLREGRDVRRVAASIVTTTTTTAALTGGSATDGTGSAASFSYNGTVGAGLPTITTALGNIDNAGSFGEWTCPWNTAGSSSTGLTALATAIEAAGNGEANKNQHLTIASIDAEATAAAIAASVTPVLGSSLRYIIGFCPDAGQMGYELAARRAAMIAAWRTPATNSDAYFGGTPFQTRNGVPLNLPAPRIRPTRGTINAAINDGLEVWGVADGLLGVVRGRNASTAAEEELWDPSYIRQQDYHRRDAKADGILTQPGEISTASVEGWGVGLLDRWEKLGLFDGAEQLKGAVKAEVDASARDDVNLFLPSSPVIMTHRFLTVLGRSAPAL